MTLKPYLMSTTTSTCFSVTYPSLVQTVHSTSLILPLPTTNISGENTVLNSLKCWLYLDDSQCGRKFASKPSEEVSFYEDLTLNEHGNTYTSWHWHEGQCPMYDAKFEIISSLFC